MTVMRPSGTRAARGTHVTMHGGPGPLPATTRWCVSLSQGSIGMVCGARFQLLGIYVTLCCRIQVLSKESCSILFLKVSFCPNFLSLTL